MPPIKNVALMLAVARKGILKLKKGPIANGGRQGGNAIGAQQRFHGIIGQRPGMGGNIFGDARAIGGDRTWRRANPAQDGL